MSKISPIPQEARRYQGQRAGLATRMLAAVIDGVVAIVVSIGGYLALAGLQFLIRPWDFRFPRVPFWVGLLVTLLVAVIYLTIAWSAGGRTYGAHVMGVRVVGWRGHRMRPVVAFARALLCVLFPIGLFWCAFNRRARSVQDLIFRSTVIYDWHPRGSATQPAQDED